MFLCQHIPRGGGCTISLLQSRPNDDASSYNDIAPCSIMRNPTRTDKPRRAPHFGQSTPLVLKFQVPLNHINQLLGHRRAQSLHPGGAAVAIFRGFRSRHRERGLSKTVKGDHPRYVNPDVRIIMRPRLTQSTCGCLLGTMSRHVIVDFCILLCTMMPSLCHLGFGFVVGTREVLNASASAATSQNETLFKTCNTSPNGWCPDPFRLAGLS